MTDIRDLEELAPIEEAQELKPTKIEFSTKTRTRVCVLETSMLEDFQINPREQVYRKTIDELSTVSSEELEPIVVAHIEGPMMWKGKNLENKYGIVDGHHRWISRKENGHGLIKAVIRQYTDLHELLKDAFVLNVTHGNRLTKDEIQKKSEELMLLHFENKDNDEYTKTIRGLATEFKISRETLSNNYTKVVIINALTNGNKEHSLVIARKINISIFRYLTKLINQSDATIQMFFENFHSYLAGGINTLEKRKELKIILDLFVDKKILTYSDFLEQLVPEDDDQQIFTPKLKARRVLSLDEDEEDEEDDLLEKEKNYSNSEKEKNINKAFANNKMPTINLKNLVDKIFSETKSMFEGVSKALEAKNVELEFDEAEAERTIEQLDRTIEESVKFKEKLLEKLNNK